MAWFLTVAKDWTGSVRKNQQARFTRCYRQYNILKVANTTANKTANEIANKIEVAGSFSDVSY